ncbi:MAG: amidohydrolase [Sphingobacteriaceae bacterium]|nr:MAG: amidohydrolase [Sphingobacteriaceae bacterium]
MKKIALLLVPFLAVILFVAFRSPKVADSADVIYINGKVLTMDSANSIAQAVAVKDGKILLVGTSAAVSKLKNAQTTVIDLKGKTLMPGIIDGHSHFMSLGRFKTVDISPPPVGTVKTIADIVKAIKEYQVKNKIPKGEWISARGYDPDQLVEKRHPEKEDLDAAFPDNPVILTHTSGHMSVVNSKALEVSGVTEATADPAGGQLVRKPNSMEPTGLLLEKARSVLKMGGNTTSLGEQLELLKKQQDYYASYGITTAQDGSTSFESVELLQKAAERKLLFIDIEALPAYPIIDKLIGNPAYTFGVNNNHLVLQGSKIIADGSPQGRTAFFKQPYLTPVPGCDHDCTGIPTITTADLDSALIKLFKNNIHPFVHCNGDATIDMYIKAVTDAGKKLNVKSTDRRPVIIHSQFARPDQLDSYKQLGMVPALFTNHAFFWGDTHVQNLGKERAFFLSPTKTALKKGIVFTNHTDFGVTPLNQMFLLWTSVVRKSRSGVVIGPDERLTPMEGLRAITINGAYQYFEEKTKGSLEAGKLADMIIISADPLTIPVDKIKDIAVLETIKEGKTVYKKM